MILSKYPHQLQYLDEWCWAAVASSIAEFYNDTTNWTQNALAAKFLSPTCQVINANTTNPPSECKNTCDFIKVLSDAELNNYAWQYGQLRFDQIQRQINAGWPLCCIINWDTLSHVISIIGYSGNSLLVSDPQCNGIFAIDYNDFSITYREGNWTTTIGTKASN